MPSSAKNQAIRVLLACRELFIDEAMAVLGAQYWTEIVDKILNTH